MKLCLPCPHRLDCPCQLPPLTLSKDRASQLPSCFACVGVQGPGSAVITTDSKICMRAASVPPPSQTEPPQTTPSQTEPPQTTAPLTTPPQTEPPQTTTPPQTTSVSNSGSGSSCLVRASTGSVWSGGSGVYKASLDLVRALFTYSSSQETCSRCLCLHVHCGSDTHACAALRIATYICSHPLAGTYALVRL